ncbi:DUF1579 domain-containing protein [Polaromonas sp. P2-4]|nr:DUF1579 domain-containing protein [Polaromonas sp. P2-4]
MPTKPLACASGTRRTVSAAKSSRFGLERAWRELCRASPGYDPEKKAFIGSWAGSMMTHMWVYNGALDAEAKVLTLNTEGPSFAGDGKQAKYRDQITIKSKDERVLTSQVRQDDGTWKRFMTATYRRVK